MLKLGLIGKNISHSKSQDTYESLLKQSVSYSLLDFATEQDIPSLERLFEENQFDGLSVTAPYKRFMAKRVLHTLPFEIVNCIRWSSGESIGTNTDYLALQKLLPKMLSEQSLEKIILLGNGAMAELVSIISKRLCLDLTHFYRTKENEIEELDLSSQENALIINACSRSFRYRGKLPAMGVFWDFNYENLEQQKLIKNIRYVDGIELLKEQAKEAISFWQLN